MQRAKTISVKRRNSKHKEGRSSKLKEEKQQMQKGDKQYT
jgi:hypothetical protein